MIYLFTQARKPETDMEPEPKPVSPLELEARLKRNCQDVLMPLSFMRFWIKTVKERENV